MARQNYYFRSNFSLKEHNTFGFDIHTSKFGIFRSSDELRDILEIIRGEKLMILGGGSNVLFTGDFDGIVLHNRIKGITVIDEREFDGITLQAGAGEVWSELVDYALYEHWGGIENLSSIPGYVGASPMQNIGAYGVELKDVFQSLDAMEISTGKIRHFSLSDCKFGYRESIFKNELKNQYVILSVRLRLTERNHRIVTEYGAIEEELKELGVQIPMPRDIGLAVSRIRFRKLPNPAEVGNAGSFFKNPEVDVEKYTELKNKHQGLVAYPAGHKMKIAAGWLIEQCGWKGKRIGDAGVHEKQALVLVNHGNATGQEVLALSKQVQESVMQKFGVWLEREVNVIE